MNRQDSKYISVSRTHLLKNLKKKRYETSDVLEKKRYETSDVLEKKRYETSDVLEITVDGMIDCPGCKDLSYTASVNTNYICAGCNGSRRVKFGGSEYLSTNRSRSSYIPKIFFLN